MYKIRTFLFIVISASFIFSPLGTNAYIEGATTGQVEGSFYELEKVIEGVAPSYYSTEGYVLHVYTCPECPEGALCKPCDKNHIFVSDTLQEYDSNSKITYLMLYTNEAQSFEVGKKYLFLVQEPSLNGQKMDPRHAYVTDYHEIPENKDGE